MTGFAFGRFRSGPALGARVNLILEWTRLVAVHLLFVSAVACALWRPSLLAGGIVAGTVAGAAGPAIVC